MAFDTQEDVYVELYTAGGNPVGSSIIVNHDDPDPDYRNYNCPAVSMANDGRFVVAWFSQEGAVIFVQRFDENGNPLGTLPWDYYAK